jgi:hypothetical protein
MKKTLLALAVISFVSCTKDSKEEVPIDPAKSYTIEFNNLNSQNVQTHVSNDTLYLDFAQKIEFLLDPVEFNRSWALALEQDFTKSYLKGLHFRALGNASGYATDWVPINLNDAHPSLKQVTDVTVNSKDYKKLTLTRVFYFNSKLGTAQAATDKQNALLQTNTDSVKYSAYYGYKDVFSTPHVVTVGLKYTK